MKKLTYLQKRRLRAVLCAALSLAALAGFLLWRRQFPPSKPTDTLNLNGDWQCSVRFHGGGNILYPLPDQQRKQVLDYVSSLKAAPDVYTTGFGAHRWVLTRGRTRYEILINSEAGYPGNSTAAFCYRLNQQGEAPKRSLWAMVYQGDPELYLQAYQSFQDWKTAIGKR